MMSSASKEQLPFREWPADDRQRWEAVFKPGDLFDEANRGAHLAPSTREVLRASYARSSFFFKVPSFDCIVA